MEINLRPARPEDAEAMAGWFADLADLAAWGGPDVTFPLSSDQLAAWIAEAENDQPRVCLTTDDPNGVPAGHVEFLRDPPNRWARLGRFAVAPHLRGRGFGRTLFDRSLEFAYGELDVEHLVLAVMPSNERARQLYLRSGFRDEGSWPGRRKSDGQPYVMTIMGLMREEWQRRRAAPTGTSKVA
jgi:[ribosomal protein S18]-alanine N-acetyltransferase